MQTQVLIIGGGCTGTGLARDLALRGIPCILVEKRDINAGASGGNHGLLHSGARYVVCDSRSSRECQAETDLLKSLAPHCIEDSGGLFVAVPGDDENYIADFESACRKEGLWSAPLDVREALEFEPGLSPKLIAAYAVKDAAIDPFRLSLDNIGQAMELGAVYLNRHAVIDIQTGKHHIHCIQVRNVQSGQIITIKAEMVINATGAWAGQITAMAGASLEMLYSKGSLLVTHCRLTRRVINRLRPPSDGDILVPGGTVSIMGTTSVPLPDLKKIRPTRKEARDLVAEGAAMLPCLKTARYTRAYAGVRPLLKESEVVDGRAASRGFALIDHARDGLKNFLTVTGGKLTTYRLMAEKTADLAAEKLGIKAGCRTRIELLPESSFGKWTEGGRSFRAWLAGTDQEDHILCECEMVPKSHLVQVLADLKSIQAGIPDLDQLRRRSRMGKGACQGAFCSLRVTGDRYDRNCLAGKQGHKQVRDFLRARWAGQQPILWGGQLVQAELTEAMHCGLFDLEMAMD
ncbi:MAG: anaerobic glycerol-3-phosphate dehydrogenase subunit A [Desulfohalobiaceae bacterium]|nr:anaerobic glycerol-3-phosphate dehydrogenase subunit A [Desulfohalobiaceae bacterium]